MAHLIDFYFDFSSPYGYFAATRIADIAATRHESARAAKRRQRLGEACSVRRS